MTEIMSLEEYRSMIGKGEAPNPTTRTMDNNDLSMSVLVCGLGDLGYGFGGVWRKGMEVQPSTIYLEYTFSKERKFRADLAIPSERLIVEVHGGAWVRRTSKDGSTSYLGGAHHSASGRKRDMEKARLANIEGWCYLEFDWKDVKDGVAYDEIVKALKM